MGSLWPWLAVAGLGALHGLNPASGWMFAAAWGLRAGDERKAWRALLPIAIGHAAAVAVVASIFAMGMWMERALFQMVAGALFIAVASYRLLRGNRRRTPHSGSADHAGAALWSFLIATTHGAGLMLVPALVPLCISGGPAREITASGSLLMALLAVSVHMAATLATTGIIAAGVCRGVAMQPRLRHGALPRHVWTAAFAISGVLLLAVR